MKLEDLQDKVVLVTGASSGIGAAVARAFGAQGARVLVHFNRNADAARRVVADIVAAGGNAVAARADAYDTAALAALAETALQAFGRIDVLINNVGDMVQRMPLADASEEMIERILDINVHSMLAMCRACIPQFRRQGRGNIINVTSVSARHGGGPGAVLYAGAKGFVSTATRGLAKELAPFNIRVNAVAPGVIVTPLHDRHSSAQQLEAFRATIPMGRLGTPEECTGAFLYLASDALASYVTGQIIEVNGGQYMP
jgi:3-oxoacyl-[acyl-carrier protein] reductase